MSTRRALFFLLAAAFSAAPALAQSGNTGIAPTLTQAGPSRDSRAQLPPVTAGRPLAPVQPVFATQPLVAGLNLPQTTSEPAATLVFPLAGTVNLAPRPCYTMRTYQRTAANPISGVTKLTGISTCQPATGIHFKSATATTSR